MFLNMDDSSRFLLLSILSQLLHILQGADLPLAPFLPFNSFSVATLKLLPKLTPLTPFSFQFFLSCYVKSILGECTIIIASSSFNSFSVATS